MKGTVNRFIEERGFGFIDGEDGNNYFFHINDIIPRGTVLIAGQLVQYEPVTQWDGRMKAISVRLEEEQEKEVDVDSGDSDEEITKAIQKYKDIR